MNPSYRCVFRESEVSCWVSVITFDSEERARTYGQDAGYISDEKLVSIFVIDAGLRPPVGIKAEQASHVWFFSPLRGWELVPR